MHDNFHIILNLRYLMNHKTSLVQPQLSQPMFYGLLKLDKYWSLLFDFTCFSSLTVFDLRNFSVIRFYNVYFLPLDKRQKINIAKPVELSKVG